MGLIRVRDFAKECGCTPQNIYKHIRNYAAQVEGHVFDSPRGKLLDEFACDFIRDAMYPREMEAGSEVTKMAADLAELRSAYMKLGQENIRLATDLVKTQGELDRTLLDLNQHQKLLRAAEDIEQAQKDELDRLTQEATEASRRAQEAERDKTILEGYIKDAKAETSVQASEKAAWEKYATELDAWSSLGWLKRRKTPKPTPPVFD